MKTLFIIYDDMRFGDEELKNLTDCGSLSSFLQGIEDPEDFKSLLRKCNRLLPRRQVRMDHWRIQRDLRNVLWSFSGLDRECFLRINDHLLAVVDANSCAGFFAKTIGPEGRTLWKSGFQHFRAAILNEIKSSHSALRARLKANPDLKEALEKKKQAEQTVGLVDALGPITALRDALNTVEGAIRKGTITDQTIRDLSQQIKFLNSKKGMIRKALVKMKAK